MVDCPICGKAVKETDINRHLDSNCTELILAPSSQTTSSTKPSVSTSFFQTPAKRTHNAPPSSTAPAAGAQTSLSLGPTQGTKRARGDDAALSSAHDQDETPKRARLSNIERAAPLAERMRPRTLDEVHGQDLVGPNGVIRSLIESERVPSMILWGGPGTGKTTIARLIAQSAGTRFVEINSTTTGVGEVKKLFTEAKNELSLTGRKTIIFCDEIHRFNKAQQDTFLGPVEAGIITLIGATTENPSFKVINALLSRCRIFTLAKLTDDDVLTILKRAVGLEPPTTPEAEALLTGRDHSLLSYLASFADGDARTALNLLSLAIDLSSRPGMTEDTLKQSLTKTFVYDTKSDFHYDTISAFHKSVRGSDADATLYYLARMLRSGEDPLFVARRMVVMASEDVGLADNSMLSLATAAYTAAEKIGMPECAINLAHCAVALALSPKSTRSYRGYKNASHAMDEPGIAGLSIPLHLRNAPTKLMKQMGYGKEYKYNPHYLDGQVLQDYLPERLQGRRFLEDTDLGDKIDDDLVQFQLRKSGSPVLNGTTPVSQSPKSPSMHDSGLAVQESGLPKIENFHSRPSSQNRSRSLLRDRDRLVLAHDLALLVSSNVDDDYNARKETTDSEAGQYEEAKDGRHDEAGQGKAQGGPDVPVIDRSQVQGGERPKRSRDTSHETMDGFRLIDGRHTEEEDAEETQLVEHDDNTDVSSDRYSAEPGGEADVLLDPDGG